MQSLMKAVITVSSFLSCSCFSFGQCDSSSLKVNVYVTGLNYISKFTGTLHYHAIGTVTNISAQKQKFYILKNTWQMDNWLVSNDSLYISGKQYDSNFEELIELNPLQQIIFYFDLADKRKRAVKETIRFAFVESDKSDWIVWDRSNKLKDVVRKIYWSNYIEIKSNISGFALSGPDTK